MRATPLRFANGPTHCLSLYVQLRRRFSFVCILIGILVPKGFALAEPTLSGIQSCSGCHRFESILSHPVGTRPQNSVPFPLEDGRMTCLTCHDDRTQVGHRKTGNPLLRGGGKFICLECHQASPTSRLDAHGSGLTKAHLSAAPRSELKMSGLDPESRTCVQCHDGMTASDVGGHQTMGNRGDPGREHPVGVRYPQLGRGDVALASPARLDHRVRLFEGMVGCGSCHSVYSRMENLLVISNQKSQLCQTCHVP